MTATPAASKRPDPARRERSTTARVAPRPGLSSGAMARDWETWLQNSIGPASDTEEADRDRTEKRIREAIQADGRLAGNVRVFVKGSYANNTNVRRDSDVDIAVEWKSWAYITKTNEAAKYDWAELGIGLGNSG